MKKPLSEKQIRNHLQKRLDELYTKTEQDDLEFYDDRDEKYYYSWVFDDGDGKRELACDKKTGVVTTC